MPTIRATHIEAYVFRRRRGKVEFLVLRRHAGRRTLPGVWQPVTGKRTFRERMLAAAIREVREETGFTPQRWWGLETVTVYLDAERDLVVPLPLFAAEVDARAKLRLSREHDAAQWVSLARAKRLVLWESQRRGFDAVKREVLSRPELAAALEIKRHRA